MIQANFPYDQTRERVLRGEMPWSRYGHMFIALLKQDYSYEPAAGDTSFGMISSQDVAATAPVIMRRVQDRRLTGADVNFYAILQRVDLAALVLYDTDDSRLIAFYGDVTGFPVTIEKSQLTISWPNGGALLQL